MLTVLYYRYSHRFSGFSLLTGFAFLLPILTAWSIWRLEGDVTAAKNLNVSLVLSEAVAVFSRLDVSVAAIAGFKIGQLPFFLGETLLAALEHPFPESLVGHHFVGGTMAMAKAIFADPAYSQPSALATPLVVEGYLNFGVLGVVLFSVVLGWLTAIAHRLMASADLLVVILSVFIMLNLPYGVSLQMITQGLVWKSVFPFVVAVLLRDLFSPARVTAANADVHVDHR
jgi:F0F1-type ATP synthase assembly protein I